MTRLLFKILVPVVIFVLMIGLSHTRAIGGAKEVSLTVEGMTGGAGPVVVKKALEGLEGIEEATVSLKEKRADVLYDPESVTVQQMIGAINDVGFKAKLREEKDDGS